MSETGVVGTVYHCLIDGNTYRVTGSHTAVRVTDPAAIEAGRNTFIGNWRSFHLEGDGSGLPAGEMPPPINTRETGNYHVRLSSSGPPDMGPGHSFTRRELIDYFVAAGFSRAGAIGIVANLEAENGLRTTGAPASQGEEGLAQWKGVRLAKLQAYAASHGLDWHSKSAQLGYLHHELIHDYPHVYARVVNATDPQQAAQDFCAGFEIPTMDDGTPNYGTYAVRRRLAAQIAAEYGS